MKKIMIWGIGKYSNQVFSSIIQDKCAFQGFVDSNPDKYGNKWNEVYDIFSPEQTLDMEIDYYLISATASSNSIKKQAEKMGIKNDRIICFWNDDIEKYDFINKYVKENLLLKIENNKLQKRLINAKYEYGLPTIRIKSGLELLMKIYEEKCSLCRFGDGEFDIILNGERSWFQNPDKKMAEKLKEVLQSNNERVIIAIADNYGNLDKYTQNAADAIRAYMTPQKRQQHMNLLNSEREYYDAYVSRPYIIYKEKNKNAEPIIKLFDKIFKDRNILMVEGKHTKTGVRNELFKNAKSVRRIICPDVNAYSCYGNILLSVKENVCDDDLVLISLGATATVLAYDLSMYGIQAIDLGQLDNEYEWYMMQVSDRTVVEGKSVSELMWYRLPSKEIEDREYDSQILAVIE